MPIVPLGEICEMDRQALRPDDPLASGLPFVGVEHVASGSGAFNFDNGSRVGSQKSSTFRFDERHVLYSKLRPYLNKVATPDFVGRCSTELVPLLPRDGVDREFMACLLRRSETVEQVMSSVTGSRMPRTDMNELMSLSVPLPPHDEQLRIVRILNRAARIERLRTRAQKLLEEFIPALFVRMFGDPVENPNGWETVRLNEVVSEFRYGTSKKSRDAAAEGSLPVLRIPNVVNGAINLDGLKHAILEAKEQQRLKMAKGDLLFVRTNGNPQYVGRCSVFDLDLDAAFASYLIRARLVDRTPLSPFVIGAAMGLPSLRSVLLSQSRTTAGNYNINIASLGKIELPVPPMEKQERYLSLIASSRAQMLLHLQTSELAGDLRRSLMNFLLEPEE